MQHIIEIPPVSVSTTMAAEECFTLRENCKVWDRKVNARTYKTCFVPKCKNTSISSPDKLFLRLVKLVNVYEKKKRIVALKITRLSGPHFQRQFL